MMRLLEVLSGMNFLVFNSFDKFFFFLLPSFEKKKKKKKKKYLLLNEINFLTQQNKTLGSIFLEGFHEMFFVDLGS